MKCTGCRLVFCCKCDEKQYSGLPPVSSPFYETFPIMHFCRFRHLFRCFRHCVYPFRHRRWIQYQISLNDIFFRNCVCPFRHFVCLFRHIIYKALFTQSPMLQQGQTLRRERKSFKLLNEKFFDYWDQFNEHLLTPEQLLEKVAEMYTNSNAIKYAKNANDSLNVGIDHH